MARGRDAAGIEVGDDVTVRGAVDVGAAVGEPDGDGVAVAAREVAVGAGRAGSPAVGR